jgi:hypothetical protein
MVRTRRVGYSSTNANPVVDTQSRGPPRCGAALSHASSWIVALGCAPARSGGSTPKQRVILELSQQNRRRVGTASSSSSSSFSSSPSLTCSGCARQRRGWQPAGGGRCGSWRLLATRDCSSPCAPNSCGLHTHHHHHHNRLPIHCQRRPPCHPTCVSWNPHRRCSRSSAGR